MCATVAIREQEINVPKNVCATGTFCGTKTKINMTLQESFAVERGNSNVEEVGKFTKSFRIDDLSNIEDGEEFTIPSGEDYKIWSQRMMRGGQAILDRDGKPVTAEYVKCMTTGGRVVKFFPSSLTKIAFRVDPETGKDKTENRIVRPEGNVVSYVKQHPDMDDTMRKMQGCVIKYNLAERVPVRRFGVPNDKATKNDVETNPIGKWNFVGEKKPENFSA